MDHQAILAAFPRDMTPSPVLGAASAARNLILASASSGFTRPVGCTWTHSRSMHFAPMAWWDETLQATCGSLNHSQKWRLHIQKLQCRQMRQTMEYAGRVGLQDFALASHLFPTCFPLVFQYLPHGFALASNLSPTSFLFVSHLSHSQYSVGAFGSGRVA